MKERDGCRPDMVISNLVNTVFGTKLRKVEQEQNNILELDSVKEKITLKDREVVIAETFLKDVGAHTEAVYPYTLKEIKGMSREVMQPQLNIVNRSMQINGEAEKRSLRTALK